MSKRRQVAKKIAGYGDFKSPDVKLTKQNILTDEYLQGEKRMTQSFYRKGNEISDDGLT